MTKAHRSISIPVLSLVLGLAALHVLAAIHLGLSTDEAHYLLYGYRPALSYFDHPPLVGWISIPFAQLPLSDTAIRFVAIAIWLITPLVLSMMIGRKHLAFTVLWLLWCTSPMLHLLGIALIPDTLVMVLIAAAIFCVKRMLVERQPEGVPLSLWIALGVLMGLSGLAKYTAALSALAIALVLFSHFGIRLLRNKGLWISAVIAAIMISPVLIWNAQHDWISFRYQAGHTSGGAWTAQNAGVFALVQLLAYGPLVIIGAWWWLRASQSRGTRWLAIVFVAPFAVLWWLSGGGRSLPHWTAPAWIALMPLAALGIAQQWNLQKRKWIIGLGMVQVAATAVIWIVLLFGATLHWQGNANPVADLHGWDKAAHTARDIANQSQIKTITVQHWTLASRLAWYARPMPVKVIDQRYDQFDIWFGSLAPGEDAVLVDWSQMSRPLPIFGNQASQAQPAQGFQSCDAAGQLDIHEGANTISSFRFYVCRHWLAQPSSKAQD